MNETSFAKTLDRKERERKSSLQWLFSSQANENTVHHISDRRDVGVCSKKTIAESAKAINSHQRNKSDGLGGFLALDLMTGGLLTSLFHGIDPIAVMETADEIWLDRRKKPSADKAAEFTYFPL
ncbi:MAG: hypothetical protein DI586_10890 [Micavibrio aeruginosavorus]|uniref:Uncharacterized protein n=1 Tax=Micavibrio aeruginosavorus TaxID=349221 RepID=A0A2W5FF28_9BACT|nr:MAG: hypothetical protein DI586_10890 [Micavibrio aeruginosavorus]